MRRMRIEDAPVPPVPHALTSTKRNHAKPDRRYQNLFRSFLALALTCLSNIWIFTWCLNWLSYKVCTKTYLRICHKLLHFCKPCNKFKIPYNR
ncbi:hypothetical protein NC653_033476 [Populus alba x Populus x berolinensis]|uniref:Uncharacterized protein n=1 Tax=Populus alba x Populus x berolinensis TaxID=444605 RepID=A0AAD6LV00_9ROSI|nr:hypothetical protein NC653_033476 [Populus alba x Populus x berolinensis]